MRYIFVIIGFACIAVPSAVSAGPADFPVCDGYRAPTKSFDFVSLETWMSESAAKKDYRIGKPGLISCDIALQDPLLLPQYSRRKANLLQAKAIHQIATMDLQGALVSLEQSDVLGRPQSDGLFQGSIGIGNQAVRAYALNQLGRKEEARAELDSIIRARPYSPEMVDLTNRLSILLDSRPETRLARIMAQIPLEPGKLFTAFVLNLEAQNYTEAARIGPMVSFDLPKARGNWVLTGIAERQYDLIRFRAVFDGVVAYTMVAAGQEAAAKTRLAEAHSDLTEAAAEPPTPAGGGKLSKKVIAEYERRKLAAAKGELGLAEVEKAIAMRRKATDMTVSELLAAWYSAKSDLPILPDLIKLAKAPDSAQQKLRAETLAEQKTKREENIKKQADISFEALLNLMPRVEHEKGRPKFRVIGSNFIRSSNNGFLRKPEPGSDVELISFGHDAAPLPMTEEMALLSAANFAREAGKDSLLILSRNTLVRTSYVSGYLNVGYSRYAAGHEVQLRTVFFNANDVPSAYRDAAWRIIPVAKVIDALGAKYPAPALDKATNK